MHSNSFGSEYLGYRASLVLAEAEHFDPFLVEDDSARVVGALAARREFGQIIHLVFQLGVTASCASSTS